MGDCHSFDPGSKFGLEKKKKKKQPNEHPGPGAAYAFLNVSYSNLENLQQIGGNRDSPHPRPDCTIAKSLLNSSALHSENYDTTVVSPLVENHSPLVENNGMHAGDGRKNRLLLTDVT